MHSFFHFQKKTEINLHPDNNNNNNHSDNNNNNASPTSQEISGIHVEKLPYIPPNINYPDLKDRSLIADADFHLLQAQNLEDGWYSKKERGLGFILIKQDKDYFALYPESENDETDEDNAEEPLSLLGIGGTGRVKLALHLNTKKWIAIKIMFADKNQMEIYLHEYEILQRLNRLIKLANQKIVFPLSENSDNNNTITRLSNPRYSKKYEQNQVYFLMDLAKGLDLFNFYNYSEEMSLPIIIYLQIALSLVQALKLFHAQKIIHCDVKLENFVLNLLKLRSKLVDVAYALNEQTKPSTLAGTPGYVAPEIIKDGNYSYKTDLFALGVALAILFKFATQVTTNGILKIIWFEQDSKEFIHNKRFANVEDKSLKLKMYQLIEALHNNDPAKRPDLNDLETTLNSIISNCKAKDRTIKVGYLNIEDLENWLIKDPETLVSFLRLKYTQICIFKFTDQHHTQENFLAMKNFLESKKILTSDEKLTVDSTAHLQSYVTQKTAVSSTVLFEVDLIRDPQKIEILFRPELDSKDNSDLKKSDSTTLPKEDANKEDTNNNNQTHRTTTKKRSLSLPLFEPGPSSRARIDVPPKQASARPSPTTK